MRVEQEDQHRNLVVRVTRMDHPHVQQFLREHSHNDGINKSSCARGAPPKMKKHSVPVAFARVARGKKEHILQAEPTRVIQGSPYDSGRNRRSGDESPGTCKILLLNASCSCNFSDIRGRSSVIMTREKIFHLLGRSAEHALQAALSLSVCFAPNHMGTPSKSSFDCVMMCYSSPLALGLLIDRGGMLTLG